VARKRKYPKFERKRVIQGIEILLPEPPPIEEIDNYDLPKDQQRFTPLPLPKDWRAWSEDDKAIFEDEEWDKKTSGYWFINGGRIEYITGDHYMYLNWWNIDIGLPKFIDADRDYFYFWDACVKDPCSFGMVNVENRRGGKTYRSGCVIYADTIAKKNAVSGIQSKTGPDAKKVLNKAVIKPWKRLPPFFKPVDTGETSPTARLSFREPSKRSSKGGEKEYQEVLESEINFESAKEEAYDGEKLYRYIMDEAGKTVDADVYERWLITKECFVDGPDIVGKAIITTTVEEMERKGGKNLYEIWKRSDPRERNGLGQTESGLYQYFKPAYYGYRGADPVTGKRFIDEFGYSDQEAAKEYFLRRREGLIGEALSSEKRKYPFTPEEAFRMDNKDSPFDLDRIYSQIEHNIELPANTVVRGNFVWVERDKEVKFVHDDKGKWRLAWRPGDDDPETKNNVTTRGSVRYPGNTAYLCAGVDPFDHAKTTDGKKSDASSHVRRKFNPMMPKGKTQCFVAHYLARPPKPEIFYEDMIMQCFFYGMEILAETNKIGLVNYFRMRGYEKFLMHRPDPTQTAYSKRNQKEPGIPMTGDAAREFLINAIQSEVYDNCGWIEDESLEAGGRWAFNPFEETLEDWIAFELDNWTPYDSTVSAGLALLGERKYVLSSRAEPKGTTEFFKFYSNKGMRSKRLR
jgi:hypothetical protein